MRFALTVAIAGGLLFLSACGRKHRAVKTTPSAPVPVSATSRPPSSQRREKPSSVPIGYIEEGVASWYGVPYHGRPAADGEIYDMETLVAAHRLLPFNTWLKVTNVSNHKSVNVRVIDRGPFVAGRLIDLSKAAARQIDLIGPGIGPVRLEVIATPADVPSNDFYAVQVGAFSVYANAERVRGGYAARFAAAQLALKQGATPMWRVLVGKEPSIESAQRLAEQLRAEDKNVFVVRLDQTAPNPAAPVISTDTAIERSQPGAPSPPAEPGGDLQAAPPQPSSTQSTPPQPSPSSQPQSWL